MENAMPTENRNEDKEFILKLTIIGAIFVIIVGTAWHFIYDWSGNSVIVGLFAPMNESCGNI